MDGVLYFTRRGFEQQLAKTRDLEAELRRLQRQTAHAAEVGGNQYHDNASYEYLLVQIHAADRRLAEEMAVLNRAEIRDSPRDPEWVQLGTRIRMNVNGEVREIAIVGYGESDPEQGQYSYQTPYAQALIGARPGETRTLHVGATRTITFRILSIEPLEDRAP